MKRIYERIDQETKRAQATSNPNIKFAKLKAFVVEMVNQGYSFRKKKAVPKPVTAVNSFDDQSIVN